MNEDSDNLVRAIKALRVSKPRYSTSWQNLVDHAVRGSENLFIISTIVVFFSYNPSVLARIPNCSSIHN